MRHLRGKLDEQCKTAGLREGAPTLALERWRASAKLEEENTTSTKARHPFPSRRCPQADADLLSDLVSAGLAESAAQLIVKTTAEAASKLAEAVSKMMHTVASGKPLPPPPLTLTFHRHTVEFTSNKTRVKVSNGVYVRRRLALCSLVWSTHAHHCVSPLQVRQALYPTSAQRRGRRERRRACHR